MIGERSLARQRVKRLIEDDPTLSSSFTEISPILTAVSQAEHGIDLYIAQAGVDFRPWFFITLSLFLGSSFAWLCLQFLSAWFLPVFFAVGAILPFSWLENRIDSRAEDFSTDYPTVLLAASSSLKAGLTAIASLERAVRLLPKSSLVRQEVEELLTAVQQGMPRREALGKFGRTIRQPDLTLFRAAFLLALENGGKFAPTLERLARVCRDRATLIHAARVSSATMRMTSNILLVVAPLVLALVSLRSKDYWHTFVDHPVANTCATSGIIVIGLSVFFLRRMSRFKP